jgi:hypothetical protein
MSATLAANPSSAPSRRADWTVDPLVVAVDVERVVLEVPPRATHRAHFAGSFGPHPNQTLRPDLRTDSADIAHCDVGIEDAS